MNARRRSTEFLSSALAGAAMAGLFAFLVTFGLAAHRAANDVISPYDEGYHLSYVQYAAYGDVPRSGDPLSRWAEDAFSCYPVAPFGKVTPVECGVDGPSEQYPELGTNTAASWPPLYYLYAGAVTRASMAVLGLDPLHAARLASALLWACGAGVLAALAAYKSKHTLLGVLIALLAGTSTSTYSIASYVTPHSAALLLGSITIGAAVWAMRTAQPGWRVALALAAWSIVVVLTIPHAVSALVAVSVGLLAWGVLAHRRIWWSLLVSGSAVAFGGLAYVSWSILANVRARPVETAAQPTSPPESLGQAMLSSWDVFLPPGGSPDQFHSELEGTLMAVLGLVIVAATGYVLLSRLITHERALAVGLVVAVPVSGALAAYSLNFAVPARYGAALIPIFWWMLNRKPVEWWYLTALAILVGVSTWLFWVTDYFTL